MSSTTQEGLEEDVVELLVDSDDVVVVDDSVKDGDDDRDDDDDKKMPPAQMNDEKEKKTDEVNDEKKPEVVDLCASSDSDDDNGDHDDIDAYQFGAIRAGVRNKRKRQRRQEKRACQASIPSNADVIEVDLNSENDNTTTTTAIHAADLDGQAQYLRVLGPLRFDFCHRMTQHTFLSVQPVARRNTLSRELLEYKLNLPIYVSSSIFVRAMESRMDLLRALITGPEDTPYANGCFFFDISLHDYPLQPPKVNFLTTAGGTVRFNPNLYKCGKVCLSLLGTWSGPAWQPYKSTLLQVLVSIQGLIFVSDPYFNEPGYDRKTSYHNAQAVQYTKNIRYYTVQHAICDILRNALQPSSSSSSSSSSRNCDKELVQQPQQQQQQQGKNPYPEFKKVVMAHFEQRADAIMEQLRAWQSEDDRLGKWVQEAESLLNELKKRKQDGTSSAPEMASEESKQVEVSEQVELSPEAAIGPPNPQPPSSAGTSASASATATAPVLTTVQALSTQPAEPNDVVVID